MPIKPLLKRSFILIALLCLFAYCGEALHQAIKVDASSHLKPDHMAWGGIFYLSAFIWLVYQGVQDQYETLEKTPMAWLALLSTGSFLSSIAIGASLISFKEYIPYLLKANSLPAYILFIQLVLFSITITGVLFHITIRTSAVLKKKLL